jgi:hypothetical protein
LKKKTGSSSRGGADKDLSGAATNGVDDSVERTEQQGGSVMAGEDDSTVGDSGAQEANAEAEGKQALVDAQKAATEARQAADAAPRDADLAKIADAAEQISLAVASLVTPSEKMSDEDLMALAQRQKRMDAGLGVVASITGALYALHQVLIDPTFQDLLNKDVPPAVRGAMTKGLDAVLTKLGPLFSAFRKFQEPTLREKTNNMFDAGVDIAFALVELSDADARESAQKSADNIALTMGLVKKGGPLVLACIDLVKCCLSALGDNKASVPDEDTTKIGVMLDKALRARTAKREADYEKNVAEGMMLLEAQKAKLLTAGAVG